MLKKDVLSYYETSKATALALGISRQAVEKWPDLVPESSAWKLQVITKGKLRVQPNLYKPTNSTNSHAAA
jgi:transcriptional repressor of cell division inhibition gene dicB